MSPCAPASIINSRPRLRFRLVFLHMFGFLMMQKIFGEVTKVSQCEFWELYSSAHKMPLLILLGKFYYMSIVLGIINSSKLRKVEFVTACVDQACSSVKPFGWFVSLEKYLLETGKEEVCCCCTSTGLNTASVMG